MCDLPTPNYRVDLGYLGIFIASIDCLISISFLNLISQLELRDLKSYFDEKVFESFLVDDGEDDDFIF
jgi:hypothetical protein